MRGNAYYHTCVTGFFQVVLHLIDLPGLLFAVKNSGMSNNRFIIVRWSNRKMVLATGDIDGFFWVENGENLDPCFTESGKKVRTVVPQEIWDTIKALPYGPVQV